MKDRLVAGALAGTAGAIVQNLYSHAIQLLGISSRAFTDFGKIVVMLQSYSGILATILGVLAHITVGLLFGVIFAYIIMKTSHKYYLVKGLIYGIILWFLLLGFGTMWRLPMWTNVPPGDSFSILLGSIIYGLSTAYALKFLDQRTKLL